jgi:organic hydroperoxide reductase OsmC/OhrA
VQQRARVFTYGVTVERDWAARSDKGGSALPREEAWTPEHLLLAGLARCLLTSLEFHARRRDLSVAGTAAARGTVTRRESDGRFAFVEIDAELDVTLEPAPQDVRELLARAEHDCFVSASLTVTPSYGWTVNGEQVA